MAREVTIGLVQMHSGDDLQENLQKGLQGIAEAASKGAQIVALPELFRAPYFCQKKDDKFFEFAEPFPGSTVEALMKAAQEQGVVVVTSVYEKTADGKYFNTAVVIDADGSLAGKYRKIHIPNDPEHGYDEAYYFSPGDLGVGVFQTKFAKIAPQICYDQWFPEGARIAGQNGAEILIYPTAIGWPVNQLEEWKNRAENTMWKTTQVSHGIDNNCFVAAVNQVLLQDTLNFWGSSFVSDPYGQIVAEAPKDAETVLLAKCDLDFIKHKEKDWPFHSDYSKVVDKL
ncbi:MAG: nitrilase-related carbon-nitrogen hydrolase [Candidatus Gracilibacteria bacterium]